LCRSRFRVSITVQYRLAIDGRNELRAEFWLANGFSDSLPEIAHGGRIWCNTFTVWALLSGLLNNFEIALARQ
jgi:hypothetical protein